MTPTPTTAPESPTFAQSQSVRIRRMTRLPARSLSNGLSKPESTEGSPFGGPGVGLGWFGGVGLVGCRRCLGVSMGVVR